MGLNYCVEKMREILARQQNNYPVLVLNWFWVLLRATIGSRDAGEVVTFLMKWGCRDHLQRTISVFDHGGHLDFS